MKKTISTRTYGLLKSQNQVHTLNKPRILIGRSKTCLINLTHPSISKEHAIIEFEEDDFPLIKDLNSSNGTYVNGERLQNAPKRLKTNDTISFGSDITEYVFESLIKENEQTEIHTTMNNNIHDGKISLVNENDYQQPRINHFKNKNQMMMTPSYHNAIMEDTNNDNNNNNNNINELHKQIEDINKEKENCSKQLTVLLNDKDVLTQQLQSKNEEINKINDLFNQLTEEYKTLNSKHNALMIYASDLQKKVDLQDLELSEYRTNNSNNRDFAKIISEKDNIITLLQNEANYYKEQLQRFQFNLNNQSNMNSDYNSNQINKKLDTLLEKYMKENKKLANTAKYYDEQLTKQIEHFNCTISDYNERLGDILKQVPIFFKKNQKEEAAKYLVEQINYFMNENQHLRTENAKLQKELTQLKAQNNNNNIINTEECNEDKNNLHQDVEITKLKARIDELENTILSPSSVTARNFHSSNSALYNQSNNINHNNTNINPYSTSQRFEGSYNQGMMMPKENDVKECLFNAINELKEKEKIIDNLKSKLRETIHSKSQINYLDDQHIQNSMIQTLKQKDDMIKNLQSRYNASSSLNNENNNNNI